MISPLDMARHQQFHKYAQNHELAATLRALGTLYNKFPHHVNVLNMLIAEVMADLERDFDENQRARRISSIEESASS